MIEYLCIQDSYSKGVAVSLVSPYLFVCQLLEVAMSLSRVGLSVLRGVRQKSSSASNVYPGYAKTLPLKDKFGIEDSTPVFKKGGAIDNLMYGATFLVCLTGIGLSTHAYYQFSLK